MTLIKGKVTITNHPKLGKTPGNGIQIVFQKVGCSSCVFGTKTDINGDYKVSVGDGKYKVIVVNPNPLVDLLAPDQSRFVKTADSPQQLVKFDIRLRLPEKDH